MTPTPKPKPSAPALRVPPSPPSMPSATEPLSAQHPLEDADKKTGETGGQTPSAPVLPVSSGSGGESLFDMPAEADFADDVYTPAPRSNPVVTALKANGLYRKMQGMVFTE